VLTIILAERRRARERRRPALSRGTAVARGIVQLEISFVRMFTFCTASSTAVLHTRARSRSPGLQWHVGPVTQELASSLARTTVYPPPSASARRHPGGHTCEAPGERIRARSKCRASAPPLKVAPLNQALPLRAASTNPASPVKAASSNEAPRLKVALANHASPLKFASPNRV
jgi:hypothetical protein